MASKPTGAVAPIHAPIERAEFFGIRLTRDSDAAFAAVARILADHRARPDFALERCSEWIDGFGVESLTLADDSELLYVNKGDTYDATLCYVAGRGFFVSSWGDVYEAADRDREQDQGERRCANCSEWSEPGEPCGSCGRDPETGDPWPEPLRHVLLDTGHTLRTWATGGLRQGRTVVGYELADPSGSALFRDSDFYPSPLHADDADETLRALLGFLTLRPGDTNRDCFAGYSPAQQAFTESSECEALAYLYGEDGPGTFVDVDDAEGGAR
ncbi:MAG: hypothetical protein AB7O97_04130 [Planctomycetota bacterium]